MYTVIHIDGCDIFVNFWLMSSCFTAYSSFSGGCKGGDFLKNGERVPLNTCNEKG